MREKLLIVNAGSSSLKFSLCAMPSNTEIVTGLVEKIGEGAQNGLLVKIPNKNAKLDDEIKELKVFIEDNLLLDNR